MKSFSFMDCLSFLAGFWLSLGLAYWIGVTARIYADSFPARFSAESVARFQAIVFSRTGQPYPASGTEQVLSGVRWRISYSDSTGGLTRVRVEAVSDPEKFRSGYEFERALP